tara:strand:- start:464 stop:622 length:159 start_codon:yes stop_codon:yes gene_type:complete
MATRIKDLNEVVNILRDVQAFMYLIYARKGVVELGDRLTNRIDRVLKDIDVE